jgi:hypothetical protein
MSTERRRKSGDQPTDWAKPLLYGARIVEFGVGDGNYPRKVLSHFFRRRYTR